ncbi:MAG: glycosyltransferase [Acidimicrobiales bacterium]|nr:glycosyltransferase [Acidimicrobiales bacterium]
MSTTRVTGRVSIVVLNWNSGDLGAAAVASARAQRWSDLEVVVVDNASEDDSLARILADHPDVTVVRNDRNLGFGAGMNRGIAEATGEFVLPLNCDAELHADYVPTLVASINADDRCGGAGGVVGSARVGESGAQAISPVMRTTSVALTEPAVVEKVNGACPLLRSAALDDVTALRGAPYDGDYFVYGEDVDLARCLRSLGWRLRFDPAARAEHVRSFGSSPRLADRRGALRTSTLRNRHRNIVRHAPRPWPVFTVAAGVQDVGFVAIQLAKRDIAVVPDMVRAWVGAARTLFSDVRLRRRLRHAERMGKATH